MPIGMLTVLAQGVFMENGSGGFMGDLEFIGGALGIYVGNQQFTVRNLKFSNHLIAAIQVLYHSNPEHGGLTVYTDSLGLGLDLEGNHHLEYACGCDHVHAKELHGSGVSHLP